MLGPNGSGKSSLVCALCVGLAGSTKVRMRRPPFPARLAVADGRRPLPPAAAQLLGRADNVRDFVKHGCARGFTEVTLSQGPGRPAVIIKQKILDLITNHSPINNI